MSERERIKKLLRDWSYFKPMGPHKSAKKNIEEMHEQDVERLLEIGSEMASELSERK